jgi:RNA polymerase sigma factor (sigma-70 family)
VTEEIPAAQDLDDARLLDLVRAGDADAYGVLRQRHEQAARRLARELVVSPAEIDDVVAETFARVLDVMRRGGGPTDAFRPYVLTATRRVCYDRIESQRRQIPAAAHEPRDPGDPFVDTAVASLDRSLIARAFMSLPERWSAVLWHTEIERASLAEVAPIFGLTRNSVAALRQRAKEGLRHAYLKMYVAKVSRPECTPVAERLGSFIRDSLSKRETAKVSQHLDDCEDCRGAFTELTDVNSALRGVVAPIFLSNAAASYLASAAPSATAAQTLGSVAPTEMTLAKMAGADTGGSDPVAGARSGAGGYAIAAVGATASVTGGGFDRPPIEGSSGMPVGGGSGTAGAAGRAAGRGLAASGPVIPGLAANSPATSGSALSGASIGYGAGGSSWSAATADKSGLLSASRERRTSGSLRWIAAGAAIVLAAFAIAFAVTLTGNYSPAPHPPRTALGLSPGVVATSTNTPSSAATKTPSTRPSLSPSPTASVPAPEPIVVAPASGSSSTSVHLAATVAVGGIHFGNFQQVSFQVTDTGSAPTGQLTVTITLPSGASMFGNGNQGFFGGGFGWSCQPNSTGATCQHAGVSAGTQAEGGIFMTISDNAACGQPIELTATSGAVSATAQSSTGISC